MKVGKKSFNMPRMRLENEMTDFCVFQLYIQWTSQFRTSPVFECSISVQLSKGPKFERHPNTRQICPVFEWSNIRIIILKTRHFYPVFEWSTSLNLCTVKCWYPDESGYWIAFLAYNRISISGRSIYDLISGYSVRMSKLYIKAYWIGGPYRVA
jgi:hypothetical protein